MSIFSKNKQIVSDEYADVLTKIVKLSQEMATLRFDVDKILTDQHSIRGLINRKMGKSDILEEENVPMTVQEVQRALLGLGNGKD